MYTNLQFRLLIPSSLELHTQITFSIQSLSIIMINFLFYFRLSIIFMQIDIFQTMHGHIIHHARNNLI